MVGFVRDNSTKNRLYAHTEVTDQFSLLQSRIPCIVVKQTTNDQQRIHFDDFIDDIRGQTELIPITGNSLLFGNNIRQVNLPNQLDYNPTWPFDNTMGIPSGTDITKTIFTSGNITDSGVNTGIIINVPGPQNFEPQSIIYALDLPKDPGAPSLVANQSMPYATITGIGTLFGTGTAIVTSGTGTINININGGLTGSGNLTTSVFVYPYITGNIGDIQTFYGIGSIVGLVTGTYPGTGTMFGSGTMTGVITSTGTIQCTGLYTTAVGLNNAQDQFFIIYSGNTFSGTVSMSIEPNEYIVNASGAVPGLSGTTMKLSDVLWAGDQYQVSVTNEERFLYGLYGGIYNISMSFDCIAKSTIETQELADLVERFFVEKKFDLWDLYGIELKTWAQGGQTEKAYINEPFFSIANSVTLFVEWHEYRSYDIITGATGLAIPFGGYLAPVYWPPAVYTNVTVYPGNTIYYPQLGQITVNAQIVDGG